MQPLQVGISNLKTLKDLQLQYWKFYIPMLALTMPRNLNGFVANFFAGHLHSDSIITGIGIGQMMVYCIPYSCMMGFNMLFECYAGAISVNSSKNDEKLIGLLFMKCVLQGVLVFFLVLGPFLNTVHLISFLGNDAATHAAAVQFIRVACPWPLLMHIQELLVKFLVVQGHLKTPIVVGLTSLGLHSFILYMLVDVLDWAVVGVALAQSLTALGTIAGTFFYCRYYGGTIPFKRELTGELLRGWREMMKLGTFTGCRVVSANCLYILSSIICQVGGPVTAGTTVIVDRINVLFNMLVYSGGSATAFVVGSELGSGKKSRVKKAMFIGVVNWMVERSISLFVFFFTVELIGKLLTVTETILIGITKCKPAVAILYILFGLDELLAQGFLTPMGRQAVIGITAPLSIFLLGYPLMFYLVYCTKTGAAGIFWCFVASHILQCLVYLARLAFVTIDEEIQLSGERVDRGFHNKDGQDCTEFESELSGAECEHVEQLAYGTDNSNKNNKAANQTVDMKQLLDEQHQDSLLSVKGGIGIVLVILFIATTTAVSFI